MAYNSKDEYKKLKARADKYATDVSHLFSRAVNQLISIASGQELKEGEVFSYAENPRLAKKATDILRDLHSQTYAAIKAGINIEWQKANEAADQFLASAFGKAALSDPNLAGWLKRNMDAMDAFFERTRDDGMTLSNRVWNTTKQLRKEMELAMTVSIGEGESAAHISRQVRKYLKEPDRLFRRIKVVTEDGKVHYKLSKAAKEYHPERGVYRSSYKNAMRLARTETNMAYRTADSLRWQQMDFVRGVRVDTSHNHSITDICDTLKGDYPKDFHFMGWHPQCFCYATPITVDRKTFVEMQKALLNGEILDTSDLQITELPENFVKWCNDNRDRIDEATANGRLPYFLRDNKPYLKKAFSADVLKTDEYKAATAILASLKDIPDVDTSALSSAMKKLDLEAITAETQKLQAIDDELAGCQYVDDAKEMAKQWGYEAVKNIEASVKAKVEFLADHYGSDTKYGLEQQKKKLEWEAYTYLGGNMTHKGSGMPVQLKYPAWQVTQNAYIKQIKILEEKLQWQSIHSHMTSAKAMVGAYPFGNDGYSVLVDKLVSKVAAKDLAGAQKLMGEIDEMVDIIEETEKLQKKIPPKYLKDIKGALSVGNNKAAKSFLEKGKSWTDVYEYLDEAQSFVTKSQPYLDLLGEFQQAILDEDADKANEYLEKLKEKRAELDKKAARRKGGKMILNGKSYEVDGVTLGDGVVTKTNFGEDCYSQKRKDNALWCKSKDESKAKFLKKADKDYAKATLDERDAARAYTGGSGHMNRPLRGYQGGWSSGCFKGLGNVSLNHEHSEGAERIKYLTQFIDRCELEQDTWLQRGVDDNGLAGFLGIDPSLLIRGNESEVQKLVGKIIVDTAFLSCGSAKGTGFSGNIVNIYAPKGTKGLFVETRSVFNGENETILQRNTFYRITKVEHAGYRWFIDVEVYAQI